MSHSTKKPTVWLLRNVSTKISLGWSATILYAESTMLVFLRNGLYYDRYRLIKTGRILPVCKTASVSPFKQLYDTKKKLSRFNLIIVIVSKHVNVAYFYNAKSKIIGGSVVRHF